MLHEVVTSRNQTLRKGLVNETKEGDKRNHGTIVINADENQGKSKNELVEYQMTCQLNKKLSKDHQMFFIVSRFVAPGQYVPIYKSEYKVSNQQD